MSDLILHHYPLSPFSEKIRLILGYKQLSWKSVETPPMLPKPDQLALTGGYRRAPVLQIGADIYCDSSLICDVLEQHQPSPAIHPEAGAGLARVVAQWADSAMLWAAMGYNLGGKGFAALIAGMPPEVSQAFIQDRAAMGVTLPIPNEGDNASTYRHYLRRLASMLEGSDFLLGPTPSLADFSAYHPLWFTATFVPPLAGILDTAPALRPWMARVAALGHGTPETISAADAIAVAAASAPASVAGVPFVDDHGIALGERVAVAAESFGTEATEGILVAASEDRYSLRRSDPRAGTVHVHFPRVGFVLRKA